jgi:hypothetical protein
MIKPKGYSNLLVDTYFLIMSIRITKRIDLKVNKSSNSNTMLRK